MLRYTLKINEYAIPTLAITMKGQKTLEFDVSSIYKNIDKAEEQFILINNYLQTLDDGRLQNIYNIFSSVDYLSKTTSLGDMASTEQLKNWVNETIYTMDYLNWTLWFRNNVGMVQLPDGLVMDFVEDRDKGVIREKTYLYTEYVDLVGMIFLIRAIMPIYCEFFNYAKELSKHPFYLLFNLFINGGMDDESYPLNRLREYVEVNYKDIIKPGKNENLIVAVGLSDDDIVDYLIAESIFNKLLTIDFIGGDKPCNVISFIFQTIKFKGNFNQTEANKVTAKSSNKGGEKDESSYFEDYRKTTSMPIGTIVELQTSLNDYHSLAQNLGYPNFNMKMFEKELDNVRLLIDDGFDNVQIYLLGWFLHSVINPRALFYLEPMKISELLMFAKVALLDTDQSFIAVFLTSTKVEETDVTNLILKNNLNRKAVASLKDYFKFAMSEDRISTIEQTITEVSKQISSKVKKPIGEVGAARSLLSPEGYLEIPININDIIISYVNYVLTK